MLKSLNVIIFFLLLLILASDATNLPINNGKLVYINKKEALVPFGDETVLFNNTEFCSKPDTSLILNGKVITAKQDSNVEVIEFLEKENKDVKQDGVQVVGVISLEDAQQLKGKR